MRFAEGKLAAAEQVALELHLDSCAECRASVAALVRGATKQQFGRYRIDGELGQGGMGIVFRGWDPELARAVAIKVVRRADPQLRARLVREAQSLAQLSHPNVCQIYDVGQDGDEVWFAMELIDGVTLRAYAADHGYAEVHAALLGAAHGLAEAHRAGIVHRDVKPDNVLVDRRGRAVVTDFGLARIVAGDPGGPPLTSTGLVFGSPGYMAPEQLSGTAVDARADQFAWAVSAWELLVRSRPLPPDPTARLAAIATGLAPPAELPAPLGAALVRALALEPAARFASMDELLAAIASSPPPRSRRRAFAIAGVAGLCALAATVAIAKRSHDEPVRVPEINRQDAAGRVPEINRQDAADRQADATIVAAPPSPPDARVVPDAADNLPPGYRALPPLFADHHIDPDAEWKRGFDEARREHPDARVVELGVINVTAAGTVDLAHGGMVTADFFSPAAFRGGAPQPGIQTLLDAHGAYFRLVPPSGDLPRMIPWPRCTARAIWQRAAAKRRLPAGGVANLDYVYFWQTGPTWSFKMGPVELSFRDDC